MFKVRWQDKFITYNDTQIYVVFNTKFNKMEENKNLEQNLDKSNEKLHISDVISRFIEKLGVKHNIDEKYIMISYDKKDGTLDVWKQTSGSSILLEQILINDL